MGLGVNIKKLREEKGISVSELARRADLPRATISQIEKWNRNPRSDVVQKIAGGLDVDTYVLFREATGSYLEWLYDLGIKDLEWTLLRMPDLEEEDRQFIAEFAREKGRQNRRRKRRAAVEARELAEKAASNDHLSHAEDDAAGDTDEEQGNR